MILALSTRRLAAVLEASSFFGPSGLPRPLRFPVQLSPMNTSTKVGRFPLRLFHLVVLGGVLLLSSAAVAQFKVSPPQPGNGWVNTPSGGRVVALRNLVSVDIREEVVPAALQRVVQGAVFAESRGLDAVLTVTGRDRAVFAASVRDGKSLELHLPATLQAPMILSYIGGVPSIFSLGSPVLPLQPRELVNFAKATSMTRLDLQVLAWSGRSLLSMPLVIEIDVARGAIRLEL